MSSAWEMYVTAMKKRRWKQYEYCSQYLKCRELSNIGEDFSGPTMNIAGENISIPRFIGMCRSIQNGGLCIEDIEFRDS